MRRSSRFLHPLLALGAILSAGAFPALAQADEPVQPALRFEAEAVGAVGLPAGGESVLFGVSREPQGYFSRVSRHAELLIADEAGEARLELNREVPVRSVWVVADLQSGALDVATPGELLLQRADLEPGDLRRGPSGRNDRLLRSLERVDLLLVRPGIGAWRLSLNDGGGADADGVDDGKLLAALENLEPLGAAPPAPDGVLPGDRLVAIDPATLQVFTFTVPQ